MKTSEAEGRFIPMDADTSSLLTSSSLLSFVAGCVLGGGTTCITGIPSLFSYDKNAYCFVTYI